MVNSVKKGQKVWFRDLKHTRSRLGTVGNEVTINKNFSETGELDETVKIRKTGRKGLKPEDRITIVLGRDHWAEVEVEDIFTSRTESIKALIESTEKKIQEEQDFVSHLEKELGKPRSAKEVEKIVEISPDARGRWQSETM